MPLIRDFEYHRPATLPEALALLARFGEKAAPLAGGTDLILGMKDEVKTPDAVIDLKRIAELSRLEVAGERLSIGALVTFNELIESREVKEKFPLVWESSRTVGSCGLRNRATMIGNICSAVPCLDSAGPLLVYDAEVVTVSTKGERRTPIEKWFVDYKRTARKADELVKSVECSAPKKGHGGAYVKLGRYAGEDLGQVNVTILKTAEKVWKVAFGAVAAVPLRATKVEALLAGKDLDGELLAGAKRLIEQEIRPITDVRATKEYRLHMARIMFERGAKAAEARLKGTAPAYGESLL
ncbi:MAG: xanthine dehydrogenase family protein subunit M [Pseudomonadota bacterium]